MNKARMMGLVFLLGGAGAACGQAILPTFYSGPWFGATLPTGWSQQGLGSDYAVDYDNSGANAGKLDTSGDWVRINYSTAAATVSYYIRGNSLSGEYTFKVQESANGSTWTDVVTYNTANPISGSITAVTNDLLPASRHVQFIYVTKAAGNVGLDGVTVAGPAPPTVAFDPAGNQSVAVSNLLTLAVNITPAGSGLKEWSLLTGYAGASSLAGGIFQMTPAGADANKTFTLTVVGTNAVGTTTNSVQISVTPYVPPKPVITFSPAPPYSIMATQTQRLGIAVSPAGSGLTTNWTLLPAYAGSASLSGTNFTFATAAGDGPNTYVLTVVATNEHGSTTGTASIVVGEFVSPPPPGSYTASFEDGSKTGYASADVTLSNKVWNLTGILIGTAAEDLKIGGKAARLKWDPADGPETMTIQSAVLSNGIGRISLWYGPYGTHGTNAPTLAIEISESLASGWIEVGEVAAGAVEVLTYYSADVYISTPIYVRIRAKSGVPDRSANFDNVTITPYAPPASDPYEAFLLQYNVTPGDPGTAEGDDLDGDGATNLEEFEADPQTNPYDEASQP